MMYVFPFEDKSVQSTVVARLLTKEANMYGRLSNVDVTVVYDV